LTNDTLEHYSNDTLKHYSNDTFNHYSNDTVVVSPISTALAEKYNRKMMETTAETALSKIHIPKNKY
jgi:hypothetical protein